MKGITYKIIGGDGREYGPIGLNEARDWIDDERVGPQTRVWSSDDDRWLPAQDRPELKWNFDARLLAGPPVLSEEAPLPEVSPGIPAEEQLLMRRAPLPLRLAAVGCDYVLFNLGLSLLTYPWAAQISEMNDTLLKNFGSPNPDLKAVWEMFKFLATAVLPASFLYYAALPVLLGATPGKFIARLSILRVDGQPLTWFRASLRWAASMGCAMTFGFGFLPMLFTPLRQGLHDLIAGTVVVRRLEDE